MLSQAAEGQDARERGSDPIGGLFYLGDGKAGQGNFAAAGNLEAIGILAGLDVSNANAGDEDAGVAGDFKGVAGGATD